MIINDKISTISVIDYTTFFVQIFWSSWNSC